MSLNRMSSHRAFFRCASGVFLLATVLLSGIRIGTSASAGDPPPGEAAFLAENDKAMTTMMDGMAVKPSGDIDRDFAAMMIPHHQGAVDMARAELRHGKNEQLRRIAQEIVVDQLQEITAMHLALGDPLPPSAAAPTQSGAATADVTVQDHATHDHQDMAHGAMPMSHDDMK